jgi:hypothetical protein
VHGGPPTRPSWPPPNTSKKPLVLVFPTLFGIPCAMHNRVEMLAERTVQQPRLRQDPQRGSIVRLVASDPTDRCPRL